MFFSKIFLKVTQTDFCRFCSLTRFHDSALSLHFSMSFGAKGSFCTFFQNESTARNCCNRENSIGKAKLTIFTLKIFDNEK